MRAVKTAGARHCESTGLTCGDSPRQQAEKLRIRPLRVITNISVIITMALAVWLAPEASADPHPFSNLNCSCRSPADLGRASSDQIAQGIHDGLSEPHATQRSAI